MPRVGPGGQPEPQAPPSHHLHAADIAVFAKRYRGTPYVWGGWRPSPGWDCSGFVNYVLGHHFGMTLPGGFRWNGKWHGPTAAMYKVWGKAHNVPGPAQPGDLCVWSTHIGIALGPDSMISAVDQQMGTAITKIAGPGNEKLTLRRINMVAATHPGGSHHISNAGRGCVITGLMLPYLIVKGVALRAWSHRKTAQ